MPYVMEVRYIVDKQVHGREGSFRERIGKPKMLKGKPKVLTQACQGESKEKRLCFAFLNYTGKGRLETLYGCSPSAAPTLGVRF